MDDFSHLINNPYRKTTQDRAGHPSHQEEGGWIVTIEIGKVRSRGKEFEQIPKDKIPHILDKENISKAGGVHLWPNLTSSQV